MNKTLREQPGFDRKRLAPELSSLTTTLPNLAAVFNDILLAAIWFGFRRRRERVVPLTYNRARKPEIDKTLQSFKLDFWQIRKGKSKIKYWDYKPPSAPRPAKVKESNLFIFARIPKKSNENYPVQWHSCIGFNPYSTMVEFSFDILWSGSICIRAGHHLWHHKRRNKEAIIKKQRMRMMS